MSLFNKAMLGKQGWRLLTRPDALCSRVLKGKYFPNSDFLGATRKRRSSETWRAILYGRDVLNRGIIKRIGPISSVPVWNDNWIPGTIPMKPIVQLPGVTVNKVIDLLEPGSRSWNVELVRNSFIGIDAEEILKIQKSRTMEEDVLAWAHERSGQYSVWSAYRLLKEEESRRANEGWSDV